MGQVIFALKYFLEMVQNYVPKRKKYSKEVLDNAVRKVQENGLSI